jgi:TRAP-type C4-dicarboxylate transport system permease small subunit
MLDRIQKFQNLILAITLAMMAYAANATNSANNAITISLLGISCLTLLMSFVIAGLDAGGAVFYNEKSQEGVSKRIRVTMYICILISAVLIFTAQIYNAVEKVNIDSKTTDIASRAEQADSDGPR